MKTIKQWTVFATTVGDLIAEVKAQGIPDIAQLVDYDYSEGHVSYSGRFERENELTFQVSEES